MGQVDMASQGDVTDADSVWAMLVPTSDGGCAGRVKYGHMDISFAVCPRCGPRFKLKPLAWVDDATTRNSQDDPDGVFVDCDDDGGHVEIARGGLRLAFKTDATGKPVEVLGCSLTASR